MRELALFYAALADETRLRLLYLMKDGEICVCFLQGVIETNQPKISRHLAYLRRAGLIEARRDGKWMHYRIKSRDPARLTILNQVMEQLSTERQIKKDQHRLQRISCCPTRYGLNSPQSCRAPRSNKKGGRPQSLPPSI